MKIAVLVAALLCAALLAGRAEATSSSYTTHAICVTWGRYCGLGIAIAKCESGLRTWARNGQYHGLFQMGSNERRIYGDYSGAWGQARAAYHYFRDAGTSPWVSSQSCWG